MNKKNLKVYIISGIILAVVALICILVMNLSKKDSKYDHLKKYEVNEYIPTYVSSEDMVKIYLNDYIIFKWKNKKGGDLYVEVFILVFNFWYSRFNIILCF